jgi:hypothetical protein
MAGASGGLASATVGTVAALLPGVPGFVATLAGGAIGIGAGVIGYVLAVKDFRSSRSGADQGEDQ